MYRDTFNYKGELLVVRWEYIGAEGNNWDEPFIDEHCLVHFIEDLPVFDFFQERVVKEMEALCLERMREYAEDRAVANYEYEN